MNVVDERALAAQIEAAVRAVPGVSAVFRAGSTVSKVVDAGARFLRFRDDSPLVHVALAGGEPRVAVAIGVRASAGAAPTARHVHAAAQRTLSALAVAADVEVTVVHVDGAQEAPA